MTGRMRLMVAGIAGCALGNLVAADVVARAAGRDLRSEGTGNPGALNAAHILGKRWGAVVFAIDVGKGAAAARLGNRIAGSTGANLAASAAVLGHCFPIGRTGGKGVATSIGQVIGTFPVYLPVDIGVALATSTLPFLRQRTRVATSIASLTWVGFAIVWSGRSLRNPGGVEPSAALPLAAAASSIVVAVRFATESGRVDAFNAAGGPRATAA